MRQHRWLLATVTAGLLLVHCSGSTNGPSGHIVEGVDFDLLFAPPTQDEINAVEQDWSMRSPSAAGIVEEATGITSLSGTPATVRIVSHTVDGNRHYGAIIAADHAETGSRPILVYCHGGDAGENVNDVLSLLNFGFGGIPDDYVYVVPSFRSEPLTYNGVTYTSEGTPSPWDRDVDDALSLVDVTIATRPEADSARIGVVGFSRGACVAMLMAIRDPRIDLVVEFFGPTDFFGEFVQEVTTEALQGSLRDLPGLDYLNDQYIQPLKAGTMSYESVRSQMLRRSPVYYAQVLPQLQIHHGTADETVPVTEAERLIAVLTDLGRTEPDYEWYIYEGGVHNPITLSGSIPRAEEFIGRLLTSPTLATLPAAVGSHAQR